MTNQQLADELLRNWQALWFLPPAERMQRIDAIRKDLEFERNMRGVKREMADV